MLAQRISSINSLSALCEKTGANVDELSKAIGSDHRIGPHFLKASVGFGGSCFQKDILNLVYLCKHYGLNDVAEYWHQVVKINDYQKERFAQKIIDYFGGDLTGRTIAILGWAFKKDTNDSRESASIKVSELLFKKGASLLIYDPMVSNNQILNDTKNSWDQNVISQLNEEKFSMVQTKEEAIKQSDAVAIITEWEEFKRDIFNNTVVFDGRNIVSGNQVNYIGK